MFRSSHRRCFIKSVFLKISQNSKESICARALFLIKLQGPSLNIFFYRTLLVAASEFKCLMFSYGLSLNKEVDNWRTPCVRVLTKFIPESSPVKISSVKPFPVEKSLNFLPPQFVLHDLIHPGGNVE